MNKPPTFLQVAAIYAMFLGTIGILCCGPMQIMTALVPGQEVQFGNLNVPAQEFNPVEKLLMGVSALMLMGASGCALAGGICTYTSRSRARPLIFTYALLLLLGNMLHAGATIRHSMEMSDQLLAEFGATDPASQAGARIGKVLGVICGPLCSSFNGLILSAIYATATAKSYLLGGGGPPSYPKGPPPSMPGYYPYGYPGAQQPQQPTGPPHYLTPGYYPPPSSPPPQQPYPPSSQPPYPPPPPPPPGSGA